MSKTIQLTAADMSAAALEERGTILVDFWAPWCGPCRMVAPTLDALSEEYDGRITIGKLNIDENQQSAIEMGVSSIPTLILFKDGEEMERIVGAQPKPALQAFLEKHL